jgi:hypothetical protein
MLCKFRRTLDISDCHNLALWAAIVVGFFSFLWALRSLFKAIRVIPSLPAFSYAPFRWIYYFELLNGVKWVAIVSDVDPL